MEPRAFPTRADAWRAQTTDLFAAFLPHWEGERQTPAGGQGMTGQCWARAVFRPLRGTSLLVSLLHFSL